jgi:hypothetical protein
LLSDVRRGLHNDGLLAFIPRNGMDADASIRLFEAFFFYLTLDLWKQI